MSYTIDYYRNARGDCPVEEFLDALPAKLRAKNMREVALLESFGVELPAPYTKQLRGKNASGLWELRVKLSTDITRVFYFFPTEKRILLLHGFVKKSDNTPTRELETAIRYMKDAKERGL